MKKLAILCCTTIIMISMTAVVSFAEGNGLGIVDSPHDFSNRTWNTSGEICRVCHVPHDFGSNRADFGLLWNHDLSSSTYLMYAEDSHANFIDGAAEPEPMGVSKLCLGCHDGTIGIDQFDGNAGSVYISSFAGGEFQVPGIPDVSGDKNMSNTHPISIEYNNVADPNLWDPTTRVMGLSGTIADVLDNGKVQCSSCHDVHDQESVPNTNLLRVAQSATQGGTASGLCLTCHIK